MNVYSDNDIQEIYRGFKLTPPSSQQESISNNQLKECKELATESADKAKENSEKMAKIYGPSINNIDHYGTILVGCLSDEKGSKGWSVSEKQNGKWEAVTMRYAARTLMKLNPNK
jgi:hypothetical protein